MNITSDGLRIVWNV